MTKSDLVRESIIKGYLDGKSYDEIAAENTTAKGTVYNIINGWIDKIGIPDINEIREFSVMLRKSGITIKQCIQSFRFINILSNFGITDEVESSDVMVIFKDIDEKEESSQIRKKKISERKKVYSSTSRNNFYYFIENIYNNCKRNRIGSTNIIQWIQDLLEFAPSLTDNSKDGSSGLENDIDEQIEFQEIKTIKKSQSEESQAMLNEREIQVPFISKINYYIQQEKSKVQNIRTYSRNLQQKIRYYEEQKSVLDSRITNLQRKERLSLTYLDWFNRLRKELLEIHGIKLEEEVNSFAKAINDFKSYGYESHDIVKEYKRMESLAFEMKSIRGIVDSIEKTRVDTLKEIKSLEERKNYSRQSLDILQELRYAGFGFKELKQLKNTIVEIAQSNGISWFDSGKKFIEDVENQYDDKLGYETKINELKVEIKKLEAEIPGYKEHLQSQVNALGVLQYLYKFGVTDFDIINMSHIVTAYADGNMTFNPNLQSESIVDENKAIKKGYYWNSLINEIRNLGDINAQVRNQRDVLNTIKKEIEVLNSQRQKINEQTLLSSQLFNFLSGRLFYIIEFLNQIMTTAQQLNKIFILSQSHFLICVIIVSENSKNGNDEIDELEEDE